MKTAEVSFGNWRLKFEIDGYRPLPISYSHRGFQLDGEPFREIADELYDRALRYAIEHQEIEA